MRGREIKGGHGLRLRRRVHPGTSSLNMETLYAPHRPVKYQVVSFCFIACVTRRKVRYPVLYSKVSIDVEPSYGIEP